jgi:hypothetical protein
VINKEWQKKEKEGKMEMDTEMVREGSGSFSLSPFVDS